MQENIENKKLIKKSLAKVMKELRGNKSQFKFSAEYNIPISIINTAERELKDPQLTTLFKLAEAYGITPEEFVRKISEKLPKNFSMIER